MLLRNALGILICIFAMLRLSNGFVSFLPPQFQSFYGHQDYISSSEGEYYESASDDISEEIPQDKVGTWIKANQDEIVRCHNDLRGKVHPPASDMMKMVWSEEAARNAERVAKACSDQHSHPSKRKIKKPIATDCGENLYLSSSKDSWKEVIDDWYSEVDGFIYGHGAKTPRDMVGHYTQVVWGKSNWIGCYHQECKGLAFPHLFICHYCPAGNMADSLKTPYSRGKPCTNCKGKCENRLCAS